MQSSQPIISTLRGEMHRQCAHVAYKTTCHVAGLVDPSERFLATTGRGNRRWDGGQLALTQDACNHRLLGEPVSHHHSEDRRLRESRGGFGDT